MVHNMRTPADSPGMRECNAMSWRHPAMSRRRHHPAMSRRRHPAMSRRRRHEVEAAEVAQLAQVHPAMSRRHEAEAAEVAQVHHCWPCHCQPLRILEQWFHGVHNEAHVVVGAGCHCNVEWSTRDTAKPSPPAFPSSIPETSSTGPAPPRRPAMRHMPARLSLSDSGLGNVGRSPVHAHPWIATQ